MINSNPSLGVQSLLIDVINSACKASSNAQEWQAFSAVPYGTKLPYIKIASIEIKPPVALGAEVLLANITLDLISNNKNNAPLLNMQSVLKSVVANSLVGASNDTFILKYANIGAFKLQEDPALGVWFCQCLITIGY